MFFDPLMCNTRDGGEQCTRLVRSLGCGWFFAMVSWLCLFIHNVFRE